MKSKALFTESTDVPAQKSVAEIIALLMHAGAVAINQDLKDGKLTGLSFVLPFSGGRIPYQLPLRVGPVFDKINGRRDPYGRFSRKEMAPKDREQAERVAWRQLYWWLKSQLALIDLGMVEAAEVLMPYMLGPDGRSFFDTYRPKMLAAPEKVQ